MTYKDTKQTQERYAIKKSSKWKTAGSVLVASLIFGSSVVLNENKASADETNTDSTLSTVTTGETTADLIEESVQTEDSSTLLKQAQNRLQVLQLQLQRRIQLRTLIRQQQVRQRTRLLHQQAVKHLIIQVLPQLQKQVLLKLLKAQLVKPQHLKRTMQTKTLALIQAQAPLKPLHLKQLQC